MRFCGHFVALTCIVLLSACVSDEILSVDDVSNNASVNSVTEQQLTEEAALELARQKTLREEAEKARVEAVALRAEALRQQEIARKEAEQEAQRLAMEARRQAVEAQRKRELVQQAAEQAIIVARQKARIEALRVEISSSNSATSNLEEANTLLYEAIVAAEDLSTALSVEQKKYSSTDPESGEMLEELATTSLNELSEEMERLRIQAEMLANESK